MEERSVTVEMEERSVTVEMEESVTLYSALTT